MNIQSASSLFFSTAHLLLGLVALQHVSPGMLRAAKPQFDWVSGGGSQVSDKTRAIAVDASGNTYLAGEISGPAEFGSHAVESAGKMDVFVAKLSATGEFIWAKSFGGSETDRAYGVVPDAEGNVYVVGHFQSADMKFNGVLQPNNGDYDLFVLKLNGAGELLWGRTAGGAGYDYAHAVALDSKGEVVVSGAVVGEARFGATAVNPGSKEHPVFVAKYSPQGNLKWAKCSTGGGGSGHGIGVDARDQIYVSGSFSGEGTFDSVALHAQKGSCGFVLKLTGDGSALTAAAFPGNAPTIHEIAVDPEGRVWIAGMYKQSMQIGTHSLTSSSATNSDGFCASLDRDLKVAWVHALHGEGVDYCLGVATDGKGRAFFTGEFTGDAVLSDATMHSAGATDIFIAAFNPEGRLEWVERCGSEKGDNAYTMAWHHSGFLVLGGACIAPAQFGAKVIGSGRGAEAYGAKMTVR